MKPSSLASQVSAVRSGCKRSLRSNSYTVRPILFSFRRCLLIQVSRSLETALDLLRGASCFCIHQQIAACWHDQGSLRSPTLGRKRSHTPDIKHYSAVHPSFFQERVNPEFEALFETGVDEMSWDDTVCCCVL